jgi:hypothetical protein
VNGVSFVLWQWVVAALAAVLVDVSKGGFSLA